MALISIFILWSFLQIVSISGSKLKVGRAPASSSSSDHSSRSSSYNSDYSADISSLWYENTLPPKNLYFDRNSVWGKSLYRNHEVYEANFPINPETNACSRSYSLPLNTTVRLKAVSNSKCTIYMNTSLSSATWLEIQINRREGNLSYSTFFAENFSGVDLDNVAEIVSFPSNDCKVKLFGRSLIFHLVMTYIDIDVRNVGNITTEMTLQQNPCGIEYDGVEWYHHKWYPFVRYDRFVTGVWKRERVWIRANMFHILCPKGCSCSLGHNQWLKICQANLQKVLLVCNPNIASLSFSKRRLSKINSEAFLCYVSLRKLILRKNLIQTLPMTTFEVLKKLTFLDVGYNLLMFLPHGIFDHQLELEYLKLNNNYLSSLPSEVFYSLNKLTYLELSFNFFHTVFEYSVFYKLQNVAYLGLKDSNIHFLSNNAFSVLSYLITLNLRYNDISTLDSNVFSKLTNLTDLDLAHNKLDRIESDVFKLTKNIRRLSLDHNSLTFLMADVFKNLGRLLYLKLSNNLLSSVEENILSDSLRVLSLSQNKLSILRRDAFSNLENLKNLNLSYNFLNSLPKDVFTDLKSLLTLDLSGNLFTKFPEIALPYLSIFQGTMNFRLANNKVSAIYQFLLVELDKIGKLDLSHCRIPIIPSVSFTEYKQMSDLNLAFNEITHIMTGSFPIVLKTLKLHNNRLSSLPQDIFAGIVRLEDLSLHNNRLMVLPDFSFVKSLLYLHLSNNRLTIYPYSLQALKKVKFLRLQNNEFVHFQNTSFQADSIRYLDISGNKLLCLQSGLLDKCTSLRVLNVGDNKIRALPLGIFDSLQDVFKLSLKFNNLSTLHDNVFHSMRSLQHLYLEGNHLITLSVDTFAFNIKLRHLTLSWNKRFAIFPEAFETLAKLEVLELDGINLKNVSYGCFDSLLKLNTLLMSSNHIIYLFESIYKETTKLQFLDLCCNAVSSLPMNIFTPLNSVKYLNLAHNSLSELPSLSLCSNLIYLELSNNMLSHPSFYSFQNLSNLKMLTMQNNKISFIPSHALESLKVLRVFVLSSNLVTSLETGVFKNLASLQILRLSNNWISDIGDDSFIDLKNLKTLELQHNNVTYLSQGLFQNLTNMIFLNISHNYIQNVDLGGLTFVSSQLVVDLRGNKLMLLTSSSFPNFEVTFIVDHYSACCFMAGKVTCISVNFRSEYLTCKRMLRSVMLRLTMWFVGLGAVTFNVGVIFSRLFVGMKNTMQSVLILNLAVSDFLMGIDMLILSSADFYYHNLFPSFSENWIESPSCKIAAVLSTLSSEASVILVSLIGLDRYLGIRYPLSVHKGLGKTRTRICVVICWLISIIISLISVMVDEYIPGFYDISEVCVGLPIVKRKVAVEKDAFIGVKTFAVQPEYFYVINNRSESRYSYNAGKFWHLESASTIQDVYFKISEVSGFKAASILSIIVFIGFNLTCFMALALFYVRVFQIASGSSSAIKSTAKSQELRMAWKMSVIVLTDFLCWVPLALACLFVQCGVISVGPEFYSWTVGLILPINSCLNPFLYTLAIVLLDRQTKKKETAPYKAKTVNTLVKSKSSLRQYCTSNFKK